MDYAKPGAICCQPFLDENPGIELKNIGWVVEYI
jgi:hypothetical protein